MLDNFNGYVREVPSTTGLSHYIQKGLAPPLNQVEAESIRIAHMTRLIDYRQQLQVSDAM